MSGGRRARDRSQEFNPAEREVIAHIPASALLEGFVKAFLTALRSGVPATRLAGYTIYSAAASHVAVNTWQNSVDQIERKLAEAKRKKKRAKSYAFNAEDDDEAEEWYRTHRAASKEVKQLKADLKQLRQAPREAPLDGPFDAYTHVFTKAMENLAACGNKVSQAQHTALRTLVPRMTIGYRDGTLWASATVRINTTEGVAELGPIEWTVGTGGTGSQRARALASTAPRQLPNRSRAGLRRRLELETGMTADAAATLTNAPFPELASVVLHHAVGADYPDWVGGDWRDPEFGEWVTKVYTDPDFCWRGSGRYVRLSPERQAVVNYAAEHLKFTATDLAQAVPTLLVRRVAEFAKAEVPRLKIRPWQPIIVGLGSPVRGSKVASRTYAAVMCECGRPATVSAKVPEIPSDLLCACGLMPNAAALGLSETLRFPDEYQRLRMPHAEVMADLEQRKADWIVELTATAKAILKTTLVLGEGATQRQIETVVNSTSVNQQLRALADVGLLQRSDRVPARWSVTPQGRLAHERLLVDAP